MRRRLRAMAVIAVAVLSMPASAGAADQSDSWPVEPTCVGQAVSTDGTTMSLYVTLTAVPPPVPPVPHRAWCDVYVNGVLVASIQGDHVGLVIVGHAAVHGLPIGAYSFCGGRDGRWC